MTDWVMRQRLKRPLVSQNSFIHSHTVRKSLYWVSETMVCMPWSEKSTVLPPRWWTVWTMRLAMSSSLVLLLEVMRLSCLSTTQ